jgi:hypothetical protein
VERGALCLLSASCDGLMTDDHPCRARRIFLGRSLDLSPPIQALTALENIVLNLCWVPPLAGWVSKKRGQGSGANADR